MTAVAAVDAPVRDIVVFLFDVSGNAAKPWLEAGYEAFIVDIQHPTAYDNGGITTEGRLHKVHADLTKPWLPPFDRNRIAFVGAWPPCDHVAVSGSRWFSGKGLRKLALSVSMFATAAEFCEWSGAPYFLENPVSNMASHWRKPDHYFHPYEFTLLEPGDRYSKKTCLWVGGGFVMPPEATHPHVQEAIALGKDLLGKQAPIQKVLAACETDAQRQLIEDWYPDDRIHKCAPGEERYNIRSETPMGFSKALHRANGQILQQVAA